MNHNLETIPRLYKEARPGSDYQFSLNLLKKFKALHPNVPTKSGIMVGLGETDEEILQVMRDMRAHGIDMLTIGQYLAPSGSHLPVRRYVHPDTFKMFEEEAYEMGFSHAAVGAMVRSATTPTSRRTPPACKTVTENAHPRVAFSFIFASAIASAAPPSVLISPECCA
jgi:lipoic acid synthetase